MFFGPLLPALAMILPAACQARAPDAVTYEKATVPFDGLRPHSDPASPYHELIGRLKRQAASEAEGVGFVPVVSTTHIGRNGERLLIVAITPKRGVFYYTEYGPYPLGPGPLVIRRRGTIDVCRFTVSWEGLPGGAISPGLTWASVDVPFPDLDCERPKDPAGLTTGSDWRRVSQGASYSIVARGTEGDLKGAVVRESWPGLRNPPRQPVDGVRAVAAVAGPKERILSAIPTSVAGSHSEPSFLVRTASGRAFVGMYVGGGETTCVVEGLEWQHLTSYGDPRQSAARGLCSRLFKDYVARLGPGPGEPGPTVRPLT